MSNDRTLKQIYDMQIAPHESDLPTSMLEGLKRFCSRHNYTTMSYEKKNAWLAFGQLNCRLHEVPKAYVAVSKSMALQKGSSYWALLKQT
jgi:hypothetical protein